jgi:hypothetical protein
MNRTTVAALLVALMGCSAPQAQSIAHAPEQAKAVGPKSSMDKPPSDEAVEVAEQGQSPGFVLHGYSPSTLIARLDQCGLQVSHGWARSSYDGVWTATLRRAYGNNEVSCLLESKTGGAVQKVTLEAEFYKPRAHQRGMLEQFAKAVAGVYPEAPMELLESIASQSPWSNANWQLTRESHRIGGGHDLRLTSL